MLPECFLGRRPSSQDALALESRHEGERSRLGFDAMPDVVISEVLTRTASAVSDLRVASLSHLEWKEETFHFF